MNRIIYTFLFYLGIPFILFRLIYKIIKNKNFYDLKRLSERFSFNLPFVKPGGILLHAVSVGETIASFPMIASLRKRFPHVSITMTCITTTGSLLIKKKFLKHVQQHFYLPYDLPYAIRRVLKRVQPRLVILMETELWPNYIHILKQMNIPIVLANARLSNKTAYWYTVFSKLSRPMIYNVSWIAAQTYKDYNIFKNLGANKNTITITGSIKFNAIIDKTLKKRARNLRKKWNAMNRKIWIAASTHIGEEDIILEAHSSLLKIFPNALLILVPRHPERFKIIYNLCINKEFYTKLWLMNNNTLSNKIDDKTTVLIVDTIGDLLFFYALSDIAFVGGSLVKIGGHNLLEPIFFNKPVLSGPYLFNFNNIAMQLQQAGALEQVKNKREIVNALYTLFTNKMIRKNRITAGVKVLHNNNNNMALYKLLNIIKKFL